MATINKNVCLVGSQIVRLNTVSGKWEVLGTRRAYSSQADAIVSVVNRESREMKGSLHRG